MTFDIDANGIVHVFAKDRGDRQGAVDDDHRSDLVAPDEIERMVRDAEQHAADDRRRKEEAETRNQADTLVHRTEKLLKDEGSKFTGDEKDRVESALKGLKEALAGTNVEAIRSASDALLSASQAFAQRLYEQASAQASTSGSAGSADAAGAPPGDDEVVDAEIVDDAGSTGA